MHYRHFTEVYFGRQSNPIENRILPNEPALVMSTIDIDISATKDGK